MTAKIEWYKEVLELEPNSKVFFPLARLLAEEGQTDESIKRLEKGLDRHPEFLEARLFLIELLYTQGYREKCNAEIEQLSKMFASYAGFWQAWAACLVSEQGQADTASIIRFLAAHFVSGPLNFNEVINRGLDSILGTGKEKQAKPLPAESVHENMALHEDSAVSEFAAHSAEMLEDLDAELDTLAKPSGEGPQTVAIAGEKSATDGNYSDESILPAEDPQAAAIEKEDTVTGVNDLPIEENENASESVSAGDAVQSDADTLAGMELSEMAQENVPAIPQTGQAAETNGADEEKPQATATAEEETAICSSGSDESILPAEENENAVESVLAGDVVQSDADTLADMELCEMAPKGEPVIPHTSQAAEADEIDEEEPFSLRTRSMAEVLAEQGDIQGALDIYQELAMSATSADEAEDIKRRMATLEARLKVVNASPAFKMAEEEAAARSKEKLIGMLEALAERVEARAAG